jgi:hypothetical protein
MSTNGKKTRLSPRQPPAFSDDFHDEEDGGGGKAPSPKQAAAEEEEFFASEVATDVEAGDEPRGQAPPGTARGKKGASKAARRAEKEAARKEKGKAGTAHAVRRSAVRVVSLETRKLKKKAEASLKDWKGKERGRMVDKFFRGQVTKARTHFGHKSVYLGSESESLVVGIPMFGGHGLDGQVLRHPGCLPLEYVIAQDCFPLGLIWQIVAKYGVGKSALLAEFGRWFYLAGGGFNLCEAETKFNPKWYESIMGRRRSST